MPLYERFKIANHVSPSQHEEVNRHITDPSGHRSKEQKASDIFLLAKRLLADLPLVPTNERVYELAQDITIGEFDDISDSEDAYTNWEQWKNRTMELLKAKGILIAKVRKISHNAADEYDTAYKAAEEFINKNKDLPDVANKISAEILNWTNNKMYAISIADIALNKGLISQIQYDELYQSLGVDPNYKNKVSRLKRNLVIE